MSNNNLPVDKSEILFLYESTYSIPNGDPFTGEQRYDEETKRVLVSDVRIKRFIRDYLAQANPNSIYVLNDASLRDATKSAKRKEEAKTAEKAESGSAERFTALKGDSKGKQAEDALKELVDVRLFGGILTKVGVAVNLTGPVQFALLNPSLNAVELRMHQNTSVFASSTDKSRGAIGTTTVVPYALNQIHGWINPYSAKHTGLAPDDIKAMFRALWDSVNDANTRTKSNQNSLLLLQIVYGRPNKKLYGLDRLIKLNATDKRDEQIRSIDDYTLDFAGIFAAVDRKVTGENGHAEDLVKSVNFYTESEILKTQLKDKSKFQPFNDDFSLQGRVAEKR
jgi:CRISPR-associated protein Csh2